jgi:hypothetical protein
MGAFIWPGWLLAALVCLALFISICMNPMIGAYLFSLTYGLDSCRIMLNVRWPQPIDIHAFEILNIILLMSMVVRSFVDYHANPLNRFRTNLKSLHWLIYLVAVFIFWSICMFLWTPSGGRELNAWYKLICQFITIAFLVLTLNSYEKLLKLLKFHFFAVCVVYAGAAMYATYHVPEIDHVLYKDDRISIALQFFLFNKTGGYKTVLEGLLNGFGFCSKHEIAMILFSGVAVGLFLMHHYKSGFMRVILGSTIILFEALIYLGFDRLIIGGSLIILTFFCVIVHPWRKWAIIIFALFVSFNILGYGISRLLVTEHLSMTDTATKQYSKTASKSEYQAGSLTFRLRQWRMALLRIKTCYGFGLGPNGLKYDPSILIHAHNFLLTFAVEYGIPGALLIVAMIALITRDVYYSVFSKPRMDNAIWIMRASLTAMALSALIAYSFDVPIHWPQLWYSTGLLLASLNVDAGCVAAS